VIVKRVATLTLLSLVALGCQSQERQPATTFYERRISPIVRESCSNSPTQSGCHVAADDRGNALGNLNVSSYETLSKRHDLLIPYGPYSIPAILVKALPPFQLRLTNWENADPEIVSTAIPHAGGSLLDVTSTSFNTLSQWITRGANENNALSPPRTLERTPCSAVLGTDPLFDASVAPSSPDFGTFKSGVNPVITATCSAGNCHGSPGNSLYLTCGNTDEQARWNYFAVSDYVSADPETSELLRRTVAPAAGGTFHEGGTLFQTTDDPGYQSILAWATEKGGPTNVPTDAGFPFFAHRVQPMLVKKGCMLLGCHSPAMGHDYRLRGGSGGHFGLPATRRNYELTLEQVALESPEPTASRVLRKNLAPPVANPTGTPEIALGLLHRGGSIFERGDDCPADTTAVEGGPLDEQSPFCVIRRWIEIERENRMKDAEPLTAVVYVKRPVRSDQETPQDFETFAPGADLVRATASLDAAGNLAVSGGGSVLGGCGLSAGIDVRRPSVSWDGKTIAFAGRAAATAPWRIYVLDGTGCRVEPTIDAAPTDDTGNALDTNGELVHNFDPTFAPDGRLVFASTRGNVTNAAGFDYQGPQRTPADPSRLNANLYVVEGTAIRQLTFLLNQEMLPSFMGDGRLIMTTEKRAKGFYQLAGRRENLDGGDYHPLFGQRATIGYRQVTDIVELADKNFAAIFSDLGAAHGAGALGVVNRSLGVDQESDDPATYLQDPGAKDWPNPKFYQHGVRILDGVGRLGVAGGVYRNPSRLPNGKILVSYAADVPDVGSFQKAFSLVTVDPVTGDRSAPLVSGAEDIVWATAVYARYNRGVFKSRIDEPNGATRVSTEPSDRERSDVTILSVPILSSLMFQNTRSKRFVPDVQPLEVWEDLPPEAGIKSLSDGGSFVVSDDFGQVYVRRRLLGSVTPLEDGSAHIQVPGGAPLVYAPMVQLAGDTSLVRHHQLEQVQFYPGERVNQSFRPTLFNGVCAGCHGAVTGKDADISVNPDILTQASQVAANGTAPVQLLARSGAKGPPFP
jgi:hypothetical protein